MERTLAPRKGLAARGGPTTRLPDLALDRLRGLLDALASPRRRRAARNTRAARIALICALCALPLLGGGYLLLRHSSLTAVEHVTIRGTHGPQAHAIDAALRDAARGMSTLGVSAGALRAAVHAYPAVSAVRATPSFPHSLQIEVVEQPAVAALTVNGVRTAVAADGTALGPALLEPSLPTINGWFEPPPGGRLHDRSLLDALAAIGAAPAPVARFVASAYDSRQRGLTLAMSDGLLVYFGDGSRPHAKWDSLARVLADTSSAGASYVDVRVPEHPAAGGFPGGVPPNASATGGEAEAAQPSQSAIAALAASLSAGTGKELVGARATEEAHEAAAGESGEGEASTSTSTESEASTAPAGGAEGTPRH